MRNVFFFNILDVIKLNPDIIHIHNCGTYTFISTLIYSFLLKREYLLTATKIKIIQKIVF